LQTYKGPDLAQFTAQCKAWPTSHPTATQLSDRITSAENYCRMYDSSLTYLFVFICVYFVCFCFILHLVVVLLWARWSGSWWDWSLILRTLSSFSALTLLVGHLTRKNPSPIWSHNVFWWDVKPFSIYISLEFFI